LKRKHEAERFIRQQTLCLQKYRLMIKQINSMTTTIKEDGTGVIYLPSRAVFERITPRSKPTGLVFLDDSFLAVKEIFRYGYPTEDATAPRICHLEYGYHYQRPQGNLFFRYDFHPDIGELETHPPYHLHAAGWLAGATKLPSVPRFPVAVITLDEVLELIRVNFFPDSR